MTADLTAMNCYPAWMGEHSDTYAFQLAGLLSTIMLPPDQEMPEAEIKEAIALLNRVGPGPNEPYVGETDGR